MFYYFNMQGVSIYSKHGVCEIFSQCPEEELEHAKERQHLQADELCPPGYKSSRPAKMLNSDTVFLPVNGLCTAEPNTHLQKKKCGPGNRQCVGSTQDDHMAIKHCMNGFGEYRGKNSGGVHQCFFDPQKPVEVMTFKVGKGDIAGRSMLYTQNPQCNTNCGHVRTWHTAPMGRYSRISIMPKALCGECRAQGIPCPQDTEGFTSIEGMVYAGVGDEVLTSAFGGLQKGPDFSTTKRNWVCCKMLVCSASLDPASSWKDEAADLTPCEENAGNIKINHPPGTWYHTYGPAAHMKVTGDSAPQLATDGNTCFQTHKFFRPHPDFFDWFKTGRSSQQMCFPRHHEVPVAGSDICRTLASAGQCYAKPGICKWVPPESVGECRAKVMPGSEACEGPSTVCMSEKACEPPTADTGCDYPWYKDVKLPPGQDRYRNGQIKTHAVRFDVDYPVQVAGSRNLFNTTWHHLGYHGWKGSSGKCLTRVYYTSTGDVPQTHGHNVMGLACMARPIDHPNLAWNGEPCINSSTEQQCSSHADVCDWKPGPKCDLRFFHTIDKRCVLCKEYEKKHGQIPRWRVTSFCKQCASWQLYFSRDRGELACHVLKHFHGIGPDLMSRVDVSAQMDDHGNSPTSDLEFTFDGQRTCVMAVGSQNALHLKTKHETLPQERTLPFQAKSETSNNFVCEGGKYEKIYEDLSKKPMFPKDLKEYVEIGSPSAMGGDYYFKPCAQADGSERGANNKETSINFFETLEALAEAIKHGGLHPECPKKASVRPVVDEPPTDLTTVEEQGPSFGWNHSKPCLANSADDVAKQGRVEVASCSKDKLAQYSKKKCESFYQVDGWTQACMWVPDWSSSPYGTRCQSCSVLAANFKQAEACGPSDANAPSRCDEKCVIPLEWPSRRSYTLINPCTKYLNVWGFCGCSAKHRLMSNKKSIDCRGCGQTALQQKLGTTVCSALAPNIHPALCLSLKALGVADEQIATVSTRRHWLHGSEYVVGQTLSCIAAGPPGSRCGTISSKALWCSGGRRLMGGGAGIADEQPMLEGNTYGSWAAQAIQLQLALNNGGEIPLCPRKVLLNEAEVCANIPDSKSPEGFKKLCNSDCDISCGLHLQYPVLRGLDTFLPQSQGQWNELKPTVTGPSQIPPFAGWTSVFEPWTYWMCKDAGLDMGRAPRLGSDETDSFSPYRVQSNRLFGLFGWQPCYDHNHAGCGNVEVESIWIPGCRSDMARHMTCAGSNYKGAGPVCICKDDKPPNEPNRVRKFQTGVNTCRKNEVEQGTFECLGPLWDLKPGTACAWGFRCRTDEPMHSFYKKARWHYKLPCPGKVGKGWEWCKRSAANTYGDGWTGFGRFSPGNGTTRTCVRLPTRCNGVCNCMDCSDEEDCK